MNTSKHAVAGALAAVVALGTSVAAAQPAEPAREPWRLGPAIGAPGWLRLAFEQHTRFEHLEHDFRAAATGDATAVSLRTQLAVAAAAGPVIGGVELVDARAYASDATPLTTTMIDPLDLLQAYIGARTGAFEVKAGRFTIDVGSRRLVARNRFRNTLNAFTGVDATWTGAGHGARGFVVVPVTRLPADAEGLRANAFELDEENGDALLWAAMYDAPPLARTALQIYVIGLHERDGELASRDRQLVTFGVRWLRKPARGQLDFELELMPQVGTARATTADDDATDLTHRALSTHAELGISPAIAWKPRVALQHDYATGDARGDDDRSQRFDPLFGARRFDFGPTGIYGPISRSNIHSPGLRVTCEPASAVGVMASYRLYWLAARRDAWVPAGVRDPSGDAGRFVGQGLEVQLRWSPVPKVLMFDIGAAYLRRGAFARTAPETRDAGAAYVYTQVSTTI